MKLPSLYRRLPLLLWCASLVAAAAPIGSHAVPDDDPPLFGDARYRIRVLGNGRELAFLGEIRPPAAAEMEQVLAAQPRARVLQLRSGGGHVREAKKMADLIKAHGLDTYVGSHCYSACTMLFAAGRHREVADVAELGLHRPKARGQEGRDPASEAATREMMRDAGIPERLLDRVYSTPFEQMWVPTLKELKRSDLVTGLVKGSSTDYTPLPAMEPDEADAFLQGDRMYALLQRYEPDLYGRLAATLQEGAAKPQPTRVLTRSLNAILNQAIERWLSRATDADLVEYARLRLEQARPPAESAEPGCDLVGFGKQDGGLDILSNRDDKRELRWMEGLLEHALPQRVSVGVRTELELDGLLDTATAEGKLDRRLLTKSGREANPDKGAQCRATAAAYELMLQQPEPQRARLLRAWFQG